MRQPSGVFVRPSVSLRVYWTSIAFGAAAVQEAGAKLDVVAPMNGKQRELSGPVVRTPKFRGSY
jgi:hypothetical protein